MDRVLCKIADGAEADVEIANFAATEGADPASLTNMINEMVQTISHRAVNFHNQTTGENVSTDAMVNLMFEKCSVKMMQTFLRSLMHNNLADFSRLIQDIRLGNFKG